MISQTGVARARLTDYQLDAFDNPFEHFCFFAGVGTGKTFTGSHWAISRMFERPDLTGLIGANTYDQLSQATLRELFYWLDKYGIEYVIDRQPPRDWGQIRRVFKTYHNVLSLRIVPGIITTVFTRVMSKANPLRGTEFSWYWMDETRDTPKNTFDVVLSRLRESNDYRRGFTTTTPNGEDWSYETFVAKGDHKHGCMHVATEESVRCGLNDQGWLDNMLANYDELTAQQELFAEHVDVLGGRAYYAFGKHNRRACPWGQTDIDPTRNVIVGMDFNYDPAPMLWVVGQLGPEGTEHEDSIHWFLEIEGRQVSTRQQTRVLIETVGTDCFYQMYGDASGARGSTSNAGEHDFAQIADEMDIAGVGRTIDFDEANPRVIDRVQNMNRLAKAVSGKVSMTYSKDRCPRLDADMRKVGWRKTIVGRGKLDDKGDHTLTHAGDAAGYAAWKVLPFVRRGDMPTGIPSSGARGEIAHLGGQQR